jgi:hypothetical protein
VAQSGPMNAIPRRAFRNNLKAIGHYLTGIVIILKGVAKLEHAHEDWPYIALFFLSGGLIIIGTAVHHQLEVGFPYLQAVFYFIEFSVTLAIAWFYVSAGKKGLQYPTAGAAMLFAALAVYHFRHPYVQRGATSTTPPHDATA